MRAQLGHLSEQGPTDDVLRELTISGTSDECATAIRALYAAGADTVILQAVPGTEREQLPQIQEELLPRLHA